MHASKLILHEFHSSKYLNLCKFVINRLPLLDKHPKFLMKKIHALLHEVSIFVGCIPLPLLRLSKYHDMHRIIDDRIEKSIKGRRIRHNLR